MAQVLLPVQPVVDLILRPGILVVVLAVLVVDDVLDLTVPVDQSGLQSG